MRTIGEASQSLSPPREADQRRMGRRLFLRRAGLGAGAVLLAAGAGTTWRALDQGVFATGEGAAYAAWGDWDVLGSGDLLPLVRAAVLAANAHNTQPWTFALGARQIDLFADPARTTGALDPLRRELHISLGCALENLTLAAQARGLDPTVALLPTPGDPAHIARIDLAPGAVVASPLYAAIPRRHTDRGAYDLARPLDAATRDALAARNADPALTLVWLTTPEAKARFAELTVQATAAIIADPEQARDDFAWWRGDWAMLQARKDGITLDPGGLPDHIRALGKLLPAQSLAAYDAAWAQGVRDRQLPTAAAFGLLIARDGGDIAQRLAAGQLWQRLHLSATAQGLAMQPLCQIPERIDRERATGDEPTMTRAFAGLLPDGDGQAVMAFRIGYPTAGTHPSPRRPAAEVLRA